MAAQRQDDFLRSISEAMARRIRMVMAAGGLDTKEALAEAVGVSPSTAGRWCHLSPGEAAHVKIAHALAGKYDLSTDWKAIRDFLDLRTEAFPWGDSILYSSKPPSDLPFRALEAV